MPDDDGRGIEASNDFFIAVDDVFDRDALQGRWVSLDLGDGARVDAWPAGG